MLSKKSFNAHAVATTRVPATRIALLATLAIAMTLLLFAPASDAQRGGTGDLPKIDAAARSAIVDSVTAAIDSIYVLEEPAKRIVAVLRKNLADGDYDELTDPIKFVRRLYDDAQAINHDGHFDISASPPLNPAVAEQQQTEDPAEVARRHRYYRAMNYGFNKVEIFPGGIGYVRFDQFAHGDDAYDAAAAAMNFVANSNAVIIDLRQNGGGSAAMIRFVCGYLFEEKEHLINWDIRAEGKTVQSYSADYVPGKRITEQPVYVLTSGRTFSAAEEFTFDVKNLERAIVVGDTTGGGGHTVAGYMFDFDSLRVSMRIPYGRAYNPENNEGWEGKGVIPDIAVPAEQALITARSEALKKLIENEEDERFVANYQWGLDDLESQLNPMELAKKQMKQYIGSYGPRRIFIEDGVLYYQREDRPRLELKLMGEDLFRVGDLDYFRLSFERDEKGKVVGLIGLYSTGRRDGNKRDKG